VAAGAAVGAALALAGALGGCGGSDPVADARAPQTVTVTVPSAPAAPAQPAPTPVPPGASSDGRAGDGANADPTDSTDPTDPTAGGNGDTPASAEGHDGRSATDSTPADPASASAPQPSVHLKRATTLRSRPGGPVVAELQPTTEFRSPTVLAVVRARDGWLGVLSSALPNGRVGWISARAALEVHYSDWRVDASLSRREVVVRRFGRVVQRFPVAIGSEGTPTPQGRFAVTDKLLTALSSSPYGCCILALSGHQTATPQGWGGGDRIAIHATNLPETIGTRASLGCLRAPTDEIRRVVNTVPLGTIVTISA
jgi:lipoprotein-anchoring transpeptidase ErfK/SrfK